MKNTQKEIESTVADKNETQKPLFFNGSDYDHARDSERLTSQYQVIFDLMKDGHERTLNQIALITGYSSSSISAQLRHMRKPRFGSHVVTKKYLGNGLFTYGLIVNQKAVD